jgi:hypothetical protein
MDEGFLNQWVDAIFAGYLTILVQNRLDRPSVDTLAGLMDHPARRRYKRYLITQTQKEYRGSGVTRPDRRPRPGTRGEPGSPG